MTGLVPTSSQWVLYENPPTNGAVYSSDIELLDIASNEVHPANPGNLYDVLGELSPDGRSYFFSDIVRNVNNRIIRLEPTGFVPAHPLEGFAAVGGGLRVLSWSNDSRFALLSSGAGSVEVADMRLGTRVATENLTSIIGCSNAGAHSERRPSSPDLCRSSADLFPRSPDPCRSSAPIFSL